CATADGPLHRAVQPELWPGRGTRSRAMDSRRAAPGAAADPAAQGAVGRHPGPIMAHAVVVLSGGLDSATTLAIARERGFNCYALSLDYGQRHRADLAPAAHGAPALGA